MKQKLHRVILLALSVVAVPLIATAPVYARNGTDDPATTGTNSNTGSTSSPSAPTTKPVAVPEVHKSLSTTEIKSRIDSLNENAKTEVKALEAKKDDTKKHTEQERQKSCEARSADLTKKLNKKVADATKHKAVFDKIFTRIKDFHDTKNLDTTNYATLVANVDTAQASADAAIATLKGFDTTFDCTQVDAAASKVAAFREALKTTRDSLKAYQTSIKNLIVAVKASIPPATTAPAATNGSTSTTTPAGN
jgi:hypothetical protein